MTDLELIQKWPMNYCRECGNLLRPSVSAGTLMRQEIPRETGGSWTVVWMCCTRCLVSVTADINTLLKQVASDPETIDMSHWLTTPTPQEDEDEMADPLTTNEIMSLPGEQRDKLIQLRLLFKQLTEGTGLDPARVRATIAAQPK